MSNEERMAEIGKIVTERTEAKRDSAILAKRIQDAGHDLYQAAPLLMRAYPNVTEYREGMAIVDALVQAGGLERISKDIVEYLALQSRIASLSGCLKEIGAE